jgi:transcriptional regulator with XRE-family HTH domain
MNIVGPQVKYLREKSRMTQEQLTVQCNLINWNISRSTLAKIESQVRRVTDSEVELLARALKVKISKLYEN